MIAFSLASGRIFATGMGVTAAVLVERDGVAGASPITPFSLLASAKIVLDIVEAPLV